LGFAAYITDYSSEFVPNYIVDINGIPAWVESVHGDIYGLTYGVDPLNNDTLSYPNHVGFDSHLNFRSFRFNHLQKGSMVGGNS